MYTYLKPKTEEEITIAIKDPSVDLYQLWKFCKQDSSLADAAAEIILNRMNIPTSSRMKKNIKTCIFDSLSHNGDNRDLEIMLHYVYPSETQD